MLGHDERSAKPRMLAGRAIVVAVWDSAPRAARVDPAIKPGRLRAAHGQLVSGELEHAGSV